MKLNKNMFFIFLIIFLLSIISSYAFEYENELVLKGEREIYEFATYEGEVYHILAFCQNKNTCEEWIVIKEKDFYLLDSPITILNNNNWAYFEILRQKAFIINLPNEDYFYSKILINALGLNNNICDWIDTDKIFNDASILKAEDMAKDLAPKSCFNGKMNCKNIVKSATSIGNKAFSIEEVTSPLVIFSAYCKGNKIYFVEPSLDYALQLDTISNNIKSNNFHYAQIETLINTKSELNNIINPKYKEGEGVFSIIWTSIKKLFSLINTTYNYGMNILKYEDYKEIRENALKKFENTVTMEQLYEANEIAYKHLNDSTSRLNKLYTRNSIVKNRVFEKIEKFPEEHIWLKKVFYENVTDLEYYSSAKNKYNLGVSLEKNYKYNSAYEQFSLAEEEIVKAYDNKELKNNRIYSSQGKFILLVLACLFIVGVIYYMKKD